MRPQFIKRAVGFTLVELMVVLAITVIISAVAIPAVVKFSQMAEKPVDTATTTVVNMLRAAKMYAVTYHVEAGLAYAINAKPDSIDGVTRQFIDGIMVVRRVRDGEEANGLEINMSAGTPFVPLRDELGSIRKLSEGACILPSILEFDGSVSVGGLTPIAIYDPDSQQRMFDNAVPITPRSGMGFPQPDSYFFPAHIFQTSGLMRSSSPKARFELYVGYSPDQDIGDRFIDPNNPVEPNVSTIELYAASGRIRVVGTGEES